MPMSGFSHTGHGTQLDTNWLLIRHFERFEGKFMNIYEYSFNSFNHKPPKDYQAICTGNAK
jgi:hypothetical protein